MSDGVFCGCITPIIVGSCAVICVSTAFIRHGARVRPASEWDTLCARISSNYVVCVVGVGFHLRSFKRGPHARYDPAKMIRYEDEARFECSDAHSLRCHSPLLFQPRLRPLSSHTTFRTTRPRCRAHRPSYVICQRTHISVSADHVWR